MSGLELVATVMGLAALCGINIYLTVFVVGLALNQNWLVLPPGLEPLQVLNHPVLIALAGFFYFLEFFADKIPWVDSLWDFIHTAVRPIGAALLALAVLGNLHPFAQVVAVLMAGGLALGSHITKSGFRVMLNASPEPFSNILASFAEDGLVLGGLFLALHYPFVLLIAVIAFVGVTLYILPWCWRQVRAFLYFLSSAIWPRWLDRNVALPKVLPERERQLLGDRLGGQESIVWALPVHIGQMSGWLRNQQAFLVRTAHPDRLVLVARHNRKQAEVMEIDDFEIGELSTLLFEELHIFFRASRRTWALRFPKRWVPEMLAAKAQLEAPSKPAPGSAPTLASHAV